MLSAIGIGTLERRLVQMDRALVATMLDAASIDLPSIDPEEDYVRGAACVYDAQTEDGLIVDRFLHDHGDGLSFEERTWVFAQRRARFGVWRVTTPASKGVLSARDVARPEARGTKHIHVPSPKGLRIDDAFLARVVDYEGMRVATAVHPVVLRAPQARQVVSNARALSLLDAWHDAAMVVLEHRHQRSAVGAFMA